MSGPPGRSPLIRARYLDPREAAESAARPISDAVNIPLGELAERVHELPPKDETLLVAGPAEAAREAVHRLTARGRVRCGARPRSR